MIKCNRCGNEVKEGTKFCSKCGNNILEQQEKTKDKISNDEKQSVKKCSKCGNELGEGMVFCPKCGSKVSEDNNEQHFSTTSQQNTNDASKEEYQYKRPEKVRFSERWLLVKIAFLGIFELGFWDLLIVEGLGKLDFLGIIAAGVLFLLFRYFIDRAINDYAGNPYMLKIPFGDKIIIKIYDISMIILIIIGTLCGIQYGTALQNSISVWGVFSLKTWIAKPAIECYRLLHWSMLLRLIQKFVYSNRTKEWVKKNEMNKNLLSVKLLTWVDQKLS